MNNISKLLLLICCGAHLCTSGQQYDTTNKGGEMATGCSDHCSCSSGSTTPAGIMTDHIHPKGEWMASYTFMNMAMKGNKAGSNNAGDETVLKSYMMIPETMTMQMHMAMLMYGVTDRLTIMGMAGYTHTSMNMYMPAMSMPGMTMAASSMYSESSGITDTRLSVLYDAAPAARGRLIVSAGVTIPTGTITAKGVTMLGENERLPYNMQPGSGSWGVLPGITWIREYDKFAYGLDAAADIKLNYNTAGYRQGKVLRISAWGSYRLFPFVSGSLRAEGVNTGRISGTDAAVSLPIYENIDPTTQTANYGGQWGNAYAGLNFHAQNSRMLKKAQLMVEYGKPLFQYVNGMQMAAHDYLTATLQYKF